MRQKIILRLPYSGNLLLSDKSWKTTDAEDALQGLSEEDKSQVDCLELHNNELDSIPLVVQTLRSMKRVYFHSNYIEHLPEWIGNLTALKVLDVHNNNLHEIPPSVGKLINLERLRLHKNQLGGGSRRDTLS